MANQSSVAISDRAIRPPKTWMRRSLDTPKRTDNDHEIDQLECEASPLAVRQQQGDVVDDMTGLHAHRHCLVQRQHRGIKHDAQHRAGHHEGGKAGRAHPRRCGASGRRTRAPRSARKSARRTRSRKLQWRQVAHRAVSSPSQTIPSSACCTAKASGNVAKARQPGPRLRRPVQADKAGWVPSTPESAKLAVAEKHMCAAKPPWPALRVNKVLSARQTSLAHGPGQRH
jgi:hypothetical protein